MPRASRPLAAALLTALVSCRTWAAAPGDGDTAFMLQRFALEGQAEDQRLAESEGLAKNEARQRRWIFDIGDHVLVSDDASSEPLKGSVTGWNEADGTYDVHVWNVHPRKRKWHHVPAENVEDARPLEKEEADKASRLLREKAVVEEERRAVAKRRALDQRIADEEAEEARKEAEAYAKEHKEEIAQKAAQEAVRALRERARQAERRRKKAERDREQRKVDEEFARANVKITWVGRHHKTITLALPRTTTFGGMMSEVCEKFRLKLEDTSFWFRGNPVKPTDFPNKLRMGRVADIVMGLRRHHE